MSSHIISPFKIIMISSVMKFNHKLLKTSVTRGFVDNVRTLRSIYSCNRHSIRKNSALTSERSSLQCLKNKLIFLKDTSRVLHTSTNCSSFFNSNTFKKWNIFSPNYNLGKRTGSLMMFQAAERPDFEAFITHLNMDDSFYSWYLISELHLWMLTTRFMAEGEIGKEMKNEMLAHFWEHAYQVNKDVVYLPGKKRQTLIDDLFQQFCAAILIYDEGLLGNDIDLANALWRRFFNSSLEEIEKLELLVIYVRKSMALLDSYDIKFYHLCKPIAWPDIFQK